MNIAGGAAEVQAQALEFDLTPAEVTEAACGTAGYFSAMASETTAADLGIVSHNTGRGDGMGMNIAGGAAEVQAQALEYVLTPAEVTEAARGTARYFSAMASETTVADLGIVSDNTGRGDGMGMNIAGGAAEVQALALEYDLTPAEVAGAARGTAGFYGGTAAAGKNQPVGTAAAAFLSRGAHNAKKGAHFIKNPHAVRLGAEIGLSVMGRVAWEGYTTTSATAMLVPKKPLAEKVSKRLATARCSRAGWEFHHATHSGSTWTLEDNITFTMPGHTEENPVWHVESMREAISETYHILWQRHYRTELAGKKDDDAGMKLNWTKGKGRK